MANLDLNNSEGVSTVYKTLVCPILEYCCQVWNPYLVKHINSIESIQRQATCIICGSEKESGIGRGRFKSDTGLSTFTFPLISSPLVLLS